MKNQVSNGDQDSQQEKQNEINQPVKKVNKWMVSTFVLLIVLLFGGFYISSKNKLVNNLSDKSLPAPNALIYEKYFFPNDAKFDYKGYEGFDYIKFDDQKKVAVFNNGNIYFEYEPNKYTLSYQILNNPPEGPKEKQTQIINLEDINNKYKLVMKLHRYGLGGGPCPDFPKGFEMVSIILDNKSIFKAKFIDEKTATLNWPLGKIYLVDKGQYGWNCPNIAGLSSVKNGSVGIQYDLSLFGQNYNSQEYIDAEKSLDKVVSTIRNFWQ